METLAELRGWILVIGFSVDGLFTLLTYTAFGLAVIGMILYGIWSLLRAFPDATKPKRQLRLGPTNGYRES